MSISASQVKELREKTNIPMMECKNALVEASGDMEGAIKILKERGLSLATKRAGKDANEGRIVVAKDSKMTCLFSVGCETDFVAKSTHFLEMIDEMRESVLTQGLEYFDSSKANSLITETVSKCGEKIVIVNKAVVSEEKLVGDYIHSNGKIGSIVVFEVEGEVSSDMENLAKDMAMQITAMNPVAISQNDINQEMRDEQRNIFLKQMEGSDKPKEMLEKIINGKVNKHFAEMCLEDMTYIKDGKTKIKELVRKQKGIISINKFYRYQIGN